MSVLDYVHPLIGSTPVDGVDPNTSGGMIPSTAPPFAMTRWTPMTRENRVSVLPYDGRLDSNITGFMGTHQPAIWMGEYGNVVVAPGVNKVLPAFRDRGLPFSHADEITSPYLYKVTANIPAGLPITTEHTATSRVGFLRFSFPSSGGGNNTSSLTSHVIIQATRLKFNGKITISPHMREVYGYNPERQDSNLGPFHAPNFKGYFVARFSAPFDSYGTATGSVLHEGETEREDEELSAYVRFKSNTKSVLVRVGTSFISVDQARQNIEREIPDDRSFEDVVKEVKEAWEDKLGRVEIEGGTEEQLVNFYTGMYHALQYPNDMAEYGRYYSGYDDLVHDGEHAYTSYSIWDTFRAETSFLTLFAPERIGGMMTSMLQVFQQGGYLPMWQNPVETNIMIGSHADSILAEVLTKGFRDFDLELTYKAVYKDAMVPPINDTILQYYDREEGTPVEARAGLRYYMKSGWVAADRTSEAASRTLDYAFDDWAVSEVARLLGHDEDARFFANRSKNYRTLYKEDTGFMNARYENGTWANDTVGWTEGDHWAYSFDVMHDIPGLIKLMGERHFVELLDEHFAGGHNDHSNEPSHHISYLYTWIPGMAWKTQEKVRQIALENYHDAVDGLSGNDDCGQMSAWYILSAFGFYPVNPPSGTYAVGAPMFERVSISLPPGGPNGVMGKKLVISSPGATAKPYVKSLKLNGKNIDKATLSHRQIVNGGLLEFEMSSERTSWG